MTARKERYAKVLKTKKSTVIPEEKDLASGKGH